MASHGETPFPFLFRPGSYRADSGQNLLGESDDQPTEHTQHTLAALAGVVRLDGHTELDDAPAQDDHADGLDAGKK